MYDLCQLCLSAANYNYAMLSCKIYFKAPLDQGFLIFYLMRTTIIKRKTVIQTKVKAGLD